MENSTAENHQNPAENSFYPQERYTNDQQSRDYSSYGATSSRGITISSSISSVSAYVGNLHPSTTKEDLRSLFASCGSIRRIAVPLHQTGEIKGCGYVEFEDSDGLQRALTLHNTTLNGHTIDVFPKRDTVRDTRGIAHSRDRGYPMMYPYVRGYEMMSPYGRSMMMSYGPYSGYSGGYMNGRYMDPSGGYGGYETSAYQPRGFTHEAYSGMPYESNYSPVEKSMSDTERVNISSGGVESVSAGAEEHRVLSSDTQVKN